jgi:hypothetical protein
VVIKLSKSFQKDVKKLVNILKRVGEEEGEGEEEEAEEEEEEEEEEERDL